MNFFKKILWWVGHLLSDSKFASTRRFIGIQGLDIIEQINPTFFTKKEGFGATDINHVGIIAQEIEQILPEAIRIGKCEDIEDFRFYDQSVLLYTLLNAVKELSQKVKQLENA